MKIFTGSQIHEWDSYTMEHEPIRPIDLMERAARALTNAITQRWNKNTPVVVFAGPGNNGGDGLAVGRMLADAGYHVQIFLFNVTGHLSDECKQNRDRAVSSRRIVQFTEITQNFDPPQLDGGMLVVDALFGSGLNKPLAGGFASVAKYINASQADVVSIDVPSGLLTEDNTFNIRQNIVRATVTLTIGQRKLAMYMADNQACLGKVQVVDIGLSHEYEQRTGSPFHLTTMEMVRSMLMERPDFAHKGNMGHALIVAGKLGMAGAGVLAAKACLRSGVGLLTLKVPKCNYQIVQTAVPEAMAVVDGEKEFIAEAVTLEDIDAIGIGPGLGQHESTAIAMITQIRRALGPVVVDADGLNILANHKAWFQQLPKGIVLTPHPKEFDRLEGVPADGSFDRLKKARAMAERMGYYVVLKGHYSALCTPEGETFLNPTGNSGMATGGSGDVLTGIITGLLARGYQQREACIVGMYLHGLAGDIAAEDKGKESLVASDIIDALPRAFKAIQQ